MPFFTDLNHVNMHPVIHPAGFILVTRLSFGIQAPQQNEAEPVESVVVPESPAFHEKMLYLLVGLGETGQGDHGYQQPPTDENLHRQFWMTVSKNRRFSDDDISKDFFGAITAEILPDESLDRLLV